MKYIASIFLSLLSLYGVEVGEMLPEVVLNGKVGSKVDRTPFKSMELRGKTWLVIYSDPDKKGLNEDLFERIKSKHFSRDRYGSIAIINMAATWMPNFAINAILRSKQKKYPDTLYVRDFKKYLVKRWGMADNDMNILIIDKNQKVLFEAAGALSPEHKEAVLSILEQEVARDR